ncbi:MAG: TonB-dependent receptor [Sphingomonas sp.]
MKKIFRVPALLTGCALVALAAPAAAQDTTPQSGDVVAGDDGVIVVTAQNRSQAVQDVPIAIDVIGGDELKEAGFSGVNDVSAIAPAVQLNQDQGTVKVTVRGVGTNSNDESQDVSVVVNVDGEYINRPNVLGVSLFDMERVEVLRGPQGTLYGRNSTGGAINFIPRKPGKDFALDASASYGNYNAVRIDGGVDLPLGDVAGLRLAGFFEDRDGYVSHPARAAFAIFPAFAGGRSDDNHAYGGRASLRIEPTSQLTINIAGEYAERQFTPATFAYVDLNGAGNAPAGPGCNASGYTRVATAYAQTLCVPSGTNFLASIDRSNYAAPFYGTGGIEQTTYAIRGRISYEFSPAATLTYTGGYRNFDETAHLPLPTIYQSNEFEGTAETQSHELRLNGEVGGVVYQVGGFYFKESQYHEVGFFLQPIAFPAGTYLTYFGRTVDSDSKSAFGQIEVPLSSTLTAVGGLRYTQNDRTATYINASPFVTYAANGSTVIPGPPNAALFGAGPGRKNVNAINGQILHLGSNENRVTWLVGLNYKPNEDTLIYAKVSTGFKGGGFDAIGTYKPETNTAYEAGWKQTFAGGSTLNLGGFYYDYRDLQVSVLLDTTKGGQTFNAGQATIWGLEAEANFKVGPNTTFHATVNYLNAKYNELFAQFNVYTVPGTGTDVNGVGDLNPNTPAIEQPNFAGNRPPFSPKFIITAGIDHDFDLGGAGTITVSANTTYKSAYFLDFYNYRDGTQTAYTQSDASLTYRPRSEVFSIQVFVRNIEDIRPLTYGSFVSAGPDDIYNWQFGTPRTYGVRVAVDF